MKFWFQTFILCFITHHYTGASIHWLTITIIQHCPAVVDAKDVNRNSNESNNSTCSLRGCKQVKRLLLHIKTCPAKNSPSAPCPCNYQGCQDARKLLAHYKQCRENARAQRKQSRIMMNNKLKGKQQQQQQTNFCLICTLLARHDKEMTERLRRKKHEQQQRRQQMHSIAETDSSTEAAAIALTTMFTSSYAKSPTTSSHNSYNSQTHTKTVQFNLNANTDENSLSDPHMPPPAPRTRSRTSSMGSISSLLRAAKVKNKRPINSRPRAGSLDERRSLSSLSSSNIYLPNDPTLELELIKPTTTFDIPNHESNLDHSGNTQSDGVPFRKRSVSCSSTVSESPSRRFCDTIMEE